MIRVIADFNIQDDCWSGAADRVKDLSYEQLNALEDWIEEIFSGSTPEDTEVNDYIWFDEEDWITNALGFPNVDAFYYCQSHGCRDNYYTDGDEVKSDEELEEEFEADEDAQEDYADDFDGWLYDNGWSELDAIF